MAASGKVPSTPLAIELPITINASTESASDGSVCSTIKNAGNAEMQGELQEHRNLIRRLYDWTLSLAAHPAAAWGLFVIAFIESSFFPIPPDVLLIAMTLATPKKGLWYATLCAVGSVLGALFGYFIGYALWSIVGTYFFRYIPGFTHEVFNQVCASYEQHSVLIVFTAAFTPIPYKVITITAGVSHISLLPFIIASGIGRAGRFFLVSGLLMKFGPPVKTFIEKYFNLLTVLVVVVYILAFYLLPMLFK